MPRSRRDDRYQAGHPAPPKRADAGYVVSVQDDTDTVTVDILDEQLTGVIPLGEMPPVGAIVEVESRGDLLVIPLWFEGTPLCAPAVLQPRRGLQRGVLGRGAGIWSDGSRRHSVTITQAGPTGVQNATAGSRC